MTAIQSVKAAARWWKSYKGGACGQCAEVVVQDWRPTPLCDSRPVCVLKYGPRIADEYLGEFASMAEARREAARFTRAMDKAFEAA